MELELHPLELRYAGIRKRAPVAERALVGSLDEIGQQRPIIAVGEAERFILIDGYKRVRSLKRLARDTLRATEWQLPEVEALLLERRMRCASEDAFDQAWLLGELRICTRGARAAPRAGLAAAVAQSRTHGSRAGRGVQQSGRGESVQSF